jgi:hypothetical protein
MRIDMKMTMSTEASGPTIVTGRGACNGDTHLAGIRYRFATSDGKRLIADAVLGEDAWYFRYPAQLSKMPEGKEWVKLEGFPGQKEMSSPAVASPDETLQFLRASGNVRRLGGAKVGHVQTTRYRVTMTATQIANELRSDSIQVPDDSRVLDISPLLEAKLDELGQAS